MLTLTEALPSSSSAALPPRPRDPSVAHAPAHAHAGATVVDAVDAVSASTRIGTVARGRPPSPYIGLGTVVASWWVVFGSVLARWLLM